jgi:hypothetical protein
MSSICDAITPLQPAGKSYSMFFQLVFFIMFSYHTRLQRNHNNGILREKNAKNSAIRCHNIFCYTGNVLSNISNDILCYAGTIGRQGVLMRQECGITGDKLTVT